MKRLILVVISVAVTACMAPVGVAQTQTEVDVPEDRIERGQTGLQFLAVPVVPRSASMANAVTAQHMGSDALFSNPGTMIGMEDDVHLSLGQTQWIAEINYNYASMAFAPAEGQYGTFGISVISVDYGEILETIRASNQKGYQEMGNIAPSGLAAGLGYSRQLTDRFAVGGQVKYVRQSLASSIMGMDGSGGYRRSDLGVGSPAFDFGVLYQTGFRSLNFGVSVRNFAGELTYENESFEIPLLFSIGTSIDMMDVIAREQDIHSLLVAVDASNRRSFTEQVKVGAEYTFQDLISLRAGYVVPGEEEGISLGAGVHQGIGGFTIGADYGYTAFGLVGEVHRIAMKASF